MEAHRGEPLAHWADSYGNTTSQGDGYKNPWIDEDLATEVEQDLRRQ